MANTTTPEGTPSTAAARRSPVSRTMARGGSAALIVLGVIVGGLGLFADVIGIGGAPGIGWKQLIAIIVGLVMILIGVAPLIQSFGPSADGLDEG